ncbi:MAG: hypothetical protein JO347_12305 [Candidatus Eremiobacteraeota bacterium]|nr:hypothetical protein [Candidatus Eremiobacteraeota bacterium]
MNITELFLAQFDDEVKRTRRTLEHFPEGKDDWKPHDKSMPLGRLAGLVAGMPSWFTFIVNQDELDLNPPGGGKFEQPKLRTPAELVKALDDGAAQGRKALEGATEEHLHKPWRLLVAGKVVSEQPRVVVMRDTFSHLAHHRAQLGVYLRLNDVTVPAVYGPSADDQQFA